MNYLIPQIHKSLLQVSFLEIYNEQVNDLLSEPGQRPTGGLRVREGENGQVSGSWAGIGGVAIDFFCRFM